MKKRLKIVFGAVLLLVVIVMASFRYYAFVSDMIYTESVSHLSEIYHQSNRSLQNFVEKHCAGMHMWADYLKDVSDETQRKQSRCWIAWRNFTKVSPIRWGRFRHLSGKSLWMPRTVTPGKSAGHLTAVLSKRDWRWPGSGRRQPIQSIA